MSEELKIELNEETKKFFRGITKMSAETKSKEMTEEEYQEFTKKFGYGYFEEGEWGGFGKGWYESMPCGHPKWDQTARWIYEQFKPESVLDIGTGFGWLINALQKYCPSKGVDISEHAVNKGKKAGVQVVLGDMRKLPFKDNEFDCIVGFGVLEHIPPNFIDQVISEINRVSRRYAFFGIPNQEEGGIDTTHINLQPREYWIDKFSKYFQAKNRKSEYWLVKKGIPFPEFELTMYPS